MKRVFLGIKIPQGVSKEVSLFQKELKKIDIDAKFVEEENLHINLKFFGSQSDEIIDKIIDVVSNVVKEFQGFKVTLKGVGAFPSQNFIRVVWIGVLSKELHELFNRLEERFVEIGILSEGREFTPHLTLARLRSQKNKNFKTNFYFCEVRFSLLKISLLTPLWNPSSLLFYKS